MITNLYPDQPSIPDAQLRELMYQVQEGVSKQIIPSLTEVYFQDQANSGRTGNGTGAFVDIDGQTLLLTNSHVIKKSGIEHSFFDSTYLVQPEQLRLHIENDEYRGKPIDIGAARVKADAWLRHGNHAMAIPFERFAAMHLTVPGEILWSAGYPGARVKEFDRSVFAACEAAPCQEFLFHDGTEPHEDFDAALHFAVGYNPANAERFSESGPSSPGPSDPHGLSGSLVWNTRRIECFREGRPWSPDFAVVTGIVWGWPNDAYLIATKVECFRDDLLRIAQVFRE